MTRVSKDLSGKKALPPELQRDISTCIFCGKKFEKGGGWAGQNIHFGTCRECAHNLIHLYIDTLEDTGVLDGMDVEEKISFITGQMTEIAKKKEIIKKMLEERDALEKVGFLCYAEMTPIDFFDLSYTKNELKNKIQQSGSVCAGSETITTKDIDLCEEQVIRIVEEASGEKPHTIRYFVIPDIAYASFKLCCVAKIDNDGSTFVFADSSDVILAFDNAGYQFTVKPCIKKLESEKGLKLPKKIP